MPKKKIEWLLVFIGAFFLLTGMISLFDVGYSLKRNADIKKSYIETTAVITGFDQYNYRDSNGSHTSYHVTIDYNVNGKDYSNELGYYSSNMVKGDRITIYCDPENPEIHKNPSAADVIGFMIFGIVFCGIGGFLLYYIISDYIKVSNVIKTGKYVICTDWEEAKSNVKVNRRRYNCIKCTYTNEHGKKYYFTSTAFHPNKSPAPDLGNGVKVYVDLDGDATVYFVSFETV